MTGSELVKFIEEYKYLLRWFARRIAASCHVDLDDAQQEVYLCAWKAAGRYEPGRGVQFRTYLSSALNNLRRDLLKRWRRTPLHISVTLQEAEKLDKSFLSHVEDDLFSSEQKKQIQDALNEEFITAQERKVVKLRYERGLQCKECARKMGISRARVNQVEKKLVKKIQRHLHL